MWEVIKQNQFITEKNRVTSKMQYYKQQMKDKIKESVAAVSEKGSEGN